MMNLHFTASVIFIGFIGCLESNRSEFYNSNNLLYVTMATIGFYEQQWKFFCKWRNGNPESITEGGSIEETFDKSSGGRHGIRNPDGAAKQLMICIKTPAFSQYR